jgi:glycosyltransferase involved in cell wall biosynthesis
VATTKTREGDRVSYPTTILLLLKRVDCNDGVAAYVESLVTGLSELGDRVVIVSGPVSTPYGSENRQRAIEGVALDWIVLESLGKSTPSLSHLQRILSLIKQYDVDVVSPQGFTVLPIGYLIARLSCRPVVTNFHLLSHGDKSNPADPMKSKLSPKAQFAYRFVNAVCQSDRYLAMSSDIASFFRNECGIPERRIHTQMLGVDTTFYRMPTQAERLRARKRFGLNDGTLASVLPGRMNFVKGHDIAAASFRILREDRPDLDTVCLFAGDGDQRERIEADVLRDDADRAAFRFLGFVDRETIRDAYWATDIVLLPSRGEGFPLVIIEAMCCGGIVIRTPTSGWQDQVVEGKTGYVVPFNDPGALAAAIEKVADEPARSTMREAAMTLASTKFSKSRMIEGTAALYRELANERRERHVSAGAHA